MAGISTVCTLILFSLIRKSNIFRWSFHSCQGRTTGAQIIKRNLTDKGWNETGCPDAYPTGAFTLDDENELKDLINTAEPIPHDSDTKPRVYFIAIPKSFVGATIFNPEVAEVITGADVTILNNSNGKDISVKTGDFGDSWVDALSPDTCTVTLRKRGYPELKLESDLTAADINLGDIPMSRKDI